jgi:hypothetical protein
MLVIKHPGVEKGARKLRRFADAPELRYGLFAAYW